MNLLYKEHLGQLVDINYGIINEDLREKMILKHERLLNTDSLTSFIGAVIEVGQANSWDKFVVDAGCYLKNIGQEDVPMPRMCDV